MLKRINNWWMSLEPGEQYMYWIISFCMMLISSVATLLGSLGFLTGNTMSVFLFLTVAGIGSFVALFMFVVLFLTIIWPKYIDIKHDVEHLE